MSDGSDVCTGESVHDLHITKKDVIDALLISHDEMSVSWITDSTRGPPFM